MRQSLLLLITAVLIITSCNDPYLYREKAEFGSGIWLVNDTAVFSTNIQDKSRRYDINMTVDHDPEFAFQNLYVKVLTTFPNDSTAEQILSLQLSDGKGLWAGECGSSCFVEISLSDAVRIRQAGKYDFRFLHYSRVDTLPGINALEFSMAEHRSGS
jgi:gliding motility-associated lipoprotein GldH